MQGSDVAMVACTQCGATNRVPAAKLAQGLTPKCGRCGAPLESDGSPVHVTDATYANAVERSPLPVLLDLWAPWCGPCRQLAPVIEELARALAGRVRVAKLNTDDNPHSAARFSLEGIPTLILLRDGRELSRMVGLHPRAEIARWLESALAS
jgi:thioredoxin 2